MTWHRPAPGEQADVARLLLGAIVDGRDDGFLEIRWKPIDGSGMRRRFFYATETREFVREARRLASTADVYVGATLRTHRDDGGKRSVAPSRFVWADVDSADAIERLRAFPVPPAFVIASGSATNLHAWWIVRERLTVDQIEAANQRLAHALGADARSTDAARILRVPGTMNHKTSPPRPVLALGVNSGETPSIAQLAGNLPAPPVQRAAPVPRAATTFDPLRSIPATEYVERLTGATVPRSRLICCPLPDHADRTPSFHVGGPDESVWFCHGCGRGGSIFDLAAHLERLPSPLRGRDFITVSRALRTLFGYAEQAA